MRLKLKYKRSLLCLLAPLSYGILYVIGTFSDDTDGDVKVNKVESPAGRYKIASTAHEKVNKVESPPDRYKIASTEHEKGNKVESPPDRYKIASTAHEKGNKVESPADRYKIASIAHEKGIQPWHTQGLVSGDYRHLSVHILLLHGNTSPFSRLVASNTLSCHEDSNLHPQNDKVRHYVPAMKAAAGQMPRDASFRRWALYPTHPKCAQGQLTHLRAVQQVLNGMHHSDRYHQLFNESNWPDKITAYTTQVASTFQSSIAFLYGLLPSFKLDQINLKGSKNNFFCDSEPGCTCFGVNSFRRKAHHECRMDVKYVELIQKHKYFVDNIRSVINLQQKDNLNFAAIFKDLSIYACHNTTLPCNSRGGCITATNLESLWEVVDYHSNCINKNSNYRRYARVMIRGLLYRIAQEMNLAKTNKYNPTIHLYTGHDTTFFAAMAALELEDSVWPSFASRIVFELFHKPQTNDHFVRILQNGKVVTSEVVFCKNKTIDGFCTFDYFYHRVSNVSSLRGCVEM